jgi:small neutral amino acid transporter SnatA (MarC family)
MKVLLVIIVVGGVILAYYGTKNVLGQPSNNRRARGQRRRR